MIPYEYPMDPHVLEGIFDTHGEPISRMQERRISTASAHITAVVYETSLEDLADDEMLDAIDALPYELRQIVEGRVFGHMTWRELGEQFGYTRFTAKERWVEALEVLKRVAG